MSPRGLPGPPPGPERVLSVLRRHGAVMEGHFLLTSGRHSPTFLLCAQAFQYPRVAAFLGRSLARLFAGTPVDAVAGPAMGGVILGHEVARALGARFVFAEKSEDGTMVFRRRFAFLPGERVLMVEDAVSTGGSVRAAITALERLEPRPLLVGVGAVVDRSGGRVDFGVPFRALVRLDIPSYDPADCPLCRAGLPLVRPKDVAG